MFGREKLVFVIEDTENNLFGGYINAKIDKYHWKEGDEWKGLTITDPKSFIFSLKSNGRLTQPTKFNIKSQRRNNAFSLYKRHHEDLFALGDDIVIKKSNDKEQCRYNGDGYEYSLFKKPPLLKNPRQF